MAKGQGMTQVAPCGEDRWGIAHPWTTEFALGLPVKGCRIGPADQHALRRFLIFDVCHLGVEGDCASWRVVEFADEFGISASYDSLVLAERRGG